MLMDKKFILMKYDVKGFEAFIERYKKGLVIEQAAVDHLIS